MKYLLFSVWILCASFSFGQSPTDDFRNFANQQDALMTSAYEKRDTQKFGEALNAFIDRYNKLSASDKKNYSNYLISGYYNFSCTYSLLNNKVLALSYFKKSIEAGYANYDHIQEDTDLDNIRNEKEFKELTAKLRNLVDYLYILQKADKYNNADTRPLPAFSYQASDNPKLVALRKAFNLDSIAGKGNDTFKMINLLHWIHYLIPHDGNHENPVVKNAMSMIAECKRDHRGLNCRGLSAVLNECYLALGFKSRIVTCLPKDSLKTDTDCHVINAVYSEAYKKWLWIDPTNDAYVSNEKGELLSIPEVRSRLIKGEPLILNPEANWNRQTITKEYYFGYYMAKNLYMLESPVISQYDMETHESGKTIDYVKLLPLDYFAQTPAKTESKNQKTKTTLVTYKTNNAEVFWQAPGK